MSGTLATSKKIVWEYLFLTVLMADFGFLCSVAFCAMAMGRMSLTAYPEKQKIALLQDCIYPAVVMTRPNVSLDCRDLVNIR